MDAMQAAVLGVVQGLTEFLPVSSDGHLLLIGRLLGWPDEGLAFDAALHLGTCAALLFVFRVTWGKLVRSCWSPQAVAERRLVGRIIVATIPAAIVGLLGERFIAEGARALWVAGIGFLVSALLLSLADRVAVHRGADDGQDAPPTIRQALTTGILQVFALLPGLSRSGATIAGGLFTGLSRTRAVEFSFLLALPITAAAGLRGVVDVLTRGDAAWTTFLVGFLAAGITGIAAIRFLLRFVRTHSFVPFSVYLLGASLLAFFLR
jgi:undecaprenyl-diphosphatase